MDRVSTLAIAMLEGALDLVHNKDLGISPNSTSAKVYQSARIVTLSNLSSCACTKLPYLELHKAGKRHLQRVAKASTQARFYSSPFCISHRHLVSHHEQILIYLIIERLLPLPTTSKQCNSQSSRVSALTARTTLHWVNLPLHRYRL